MTPEANSREADQLASWQEANPEPIPFKSQSHHKFEN
jgi:hypothetical protein